MPAFSTRTARTLITTLALFRTLRLLLARMDGLRFLIGGRRRGFDAHFLVAVFHRGAAGETDTALFIHAQALDPDFIAHLDDVFSLLDAEVGQLADAARSSRSKNSARSSNSCPARTDSSTSANSPTFA